MASLPCSDGKAPCVHMGGTTPVRRAFGAGQIGIRGSRGCQLGDYDLRRLLAFSDFRKLLSTRVPSSPMSLLSSPSQLSVVFIPMASAIACEETPHGHRPGHARALSLHHRCRFIIRYLGEIF